MYEKLNYFFQDYSVHLLGKVNVPYDLKRRIDGTILWMPEIHANFTFLNSILSENRQFMRYFNHHMFTEIHKSTELSLFLI